MKRLALLLAVGTAVVGLAFGQEDRGALGLGLATAQTNREAMIAKALRFNLFVDVGKRLVGKLYYGLELQGDISELTDQSFQLQQSDVSTYHLGGAPWSAFFDTADAQESYHLWDFDLSPRGYLSLDLGDKIELLGFGGLNYNWQTLDYSIKNAGTSNWLDQYGNVVAKPGQSSTSHLAFAGNLQGTAGIRFSIAFLYIDFSRYINLSPSDLSVGNEDLSRLGTGISVRF